MNCELPSKTWDPRSRTGLPKPIHQKIWDSTAVFTNFLDHNLGHPSLFVHCATANLKLPRADAKRQCPVGTIVQSKYIGPACCYQYSLAIIDLRAKLPRLFIKFVEKHCTHIIKTYHLHNILAHLHKASLEPISPGDGIGPSVERLFDELIRADEEYGKPWIDSEEEAPTETVEPSSEKGKKSDPKAKSRAQILLEKASEASKRGVEPKGFHSQDQPFHRELPPRN